MRDIIPQNDQKRDKASFLLEVCHLIMSWFYIFILAINYYYSKLHYFLISDAKLTYSHIYMQVIEYIQFLQEKLNVYEGPYHDWSKEPKKLIPWVNTDGGHVCLCFCTLTCSVIVLDYVLLLHDILSLCSVSSFVCLGSVTKSM